MPSDILDSEEFLILDFHSLPIFFIATSHLKMKSYYSSLSMDPYFLQKSLIKTKGIQVVVLSHF